MTSIAYASKTTTDPQRDRCRTSLVAVAALAAAILACPVNTRVTLPRIAEWLGYRIESDQSLALTLACLIVATHLVPAACVHIVTSHGRRCGGFLVAVAAVFVACWWLMIAALQRLS